MGLTQQLRSPGAKSRTHSALQGRKVPENLKEAWGPPSQLGKTTLWEVGSEEGAAGASQTEEGVLSTVVESRRGALLGARRCGHSPGLALV